MVANMNSSILMVAPSLLCMVLFHSHYQLGIHGYVTEGQDPDPTYGFTSLPLNNTNFAIHKPYNLNVGSRYSVTNGVHKLWVLSSDKSHNKESPTSPRSEVRIKGYDYSAGVWQFEGYSYIPDGTSGVCVMQVFGAESTATTLMLTVFNGALMYYRKELIADDIYGKWFRLNVIHDVNARHVKVFIDGDLKLTVNDRGGKSHYFKFGVYSQKYNSSYFMESLWKDVKVLKATTG